MVPETCVFCALVAERDEAIAERDKARRIIESIDAAALTRPETSPTVTLAEEVDRLRTAVRSVLAMVDHGTALPALMHAVVELRRFVEPEVGT